jgi:hypothetical protein
MPRFISENETHPTINSIKEYYDLKTSDLFATYSYGMGPIVISNSPDIKVTSVKAFVISLLRR